MIIMRDTGEESVELIGGDLLAAFGDVLED
jgi:hypothetical protein